MNKKTVKKCGTVIILLLVLAAGLLVLQHPAKNGRKTTEYLPALTDTPVYVECGEKEALQVKLKMKETMDISGFQLFLVNISDESRGDLFVSLTDAERNLLLNQSLPVSSIVPGEWFQVSGDLTLTAGETYSLTVEANSSEPFFMKLSPSAAENLPFEETVIQNGAELEEKISLGVNQVVPVSLSYGDILYYSVPVLILLVLAGILLTVFGKDKIAGVLGKISCASLINKYGNGIFLILLFTFSCVGIYTEGYFKNVFITADSAGYLREAVNLAVGNGFHYDGLAGYQNWFANWPIIYPACIAGVMLITGTNAYLASKILSMILVALILTVIWRVYKKDAWLYALCLWNAGFVTLTYYSWSEVLFILFFMMFTMLFGKMVTEERPSVKQYVLLGVLGLTCFLTRYFGIYIWIVTGGYILYELYRYRKTKDKKLLHKAAGFTLTAFVSGVLSLAYLLMNRILNGHASGVSRTLWWDDYEILTNDLIQSLLTEITNIFGIQIPNFINAYPYRVKLLLLFVIIAFLIVFVVKNCRWKSVEGTMIAFGISYYLIFIAIRYVSSMDTFYFRFFEPASFIICLGLITLLLPFIKGKKGTKYFAAFMTAVLVLSTATMLGSQDFKNGTSYYDTLTKEWDEDYKEIPQKSVVIFSDLDFRSAYYRPDVIGGEIRPEDCFADLCEKYSGSDYLCIKREFAETMLESGEYDSTVAEKMESGLKELQDNEE